jgi:hypothetical protein
VSFFQCEHCGCCENTALSSQGFRRADYFKWTGIEDRRGKLLCSECGPSHYSDGTPADQGGLWHGQFGRVFLPMGMFVTDRDGNLAHRENGDTNFRKYAIAAPKGSA